MGKRLSDASDEQHGWPALLSLYLITLDQQRNAHAAADTQRRETPFRFSPFHFMQQRRHHAYAGATDWMAKRNRSAIYI